jgi:hypothetical protein
VTVVELTLPTKTATITISKRAFGSRGIYKFGGYFYGPILGLILFLLKLLFKLK